MLLHCLKTCHSQDIGQSMQFLDNSHGCTGWSGEMAERIRAFDWSLTELGRIDTWPGSLCSAVQLLLASPLPMVMLWGRPGYMIYNDAYSRFAGGRHPYLLGSPVELGWPEVAEFNRQVVDTCLAGGTLSYHNKAWYCCATAFRRRLDGPLLQPCLQ